MNEEFYARYVSTGQSNYNAINGKYPFSRKTHETVKRIAGKYFPNRNTKVLDLGCGSGAYLFSLQSMGYTNCVGVDISMEQIEQAKALGIKNVICANIFNYLRDNKDKFDVILAIDIVEHFDKNEIKNLMLNMGIALNQKGSILLHVPNAESPFGMRVRYGDFTHEFAFTQSSLNQLLTLYGYNNFTFFGDINPVYNCKSFIQMILRKFFELVFKLYLFSETGIQKYIFTQNIFCYISQGRRK